MKLLIILGHIISIGIFWKPSLEHMYKYAKTPEKIEYYLSFFSYQKDKTIEDMWKSPEQFVKDGDGDCEDYAIMAYELLKRIGYKPDIYSVWNPDDDRPGHAICVFENKLFNPYKIFEISLKQYMKDYNYTEYKIYDWKIRQKYMRNDKSVIEIF